MKRNSHNIRGFFTTLKRTYGLWKTFGFAYACPLCGWHARYFYPAGFDFPVLSRYQVISAGRRKNVRCPRCNSSARERLIYLFLKRRTGAFSNPLDILHIAPEKNLQHTLKRRSRGTHISGDIEPGAADTTFDIQKIPFANERFDLVICSHVLEHIIDDARAMHELYRVLRSGGIAILQVPYSPLLTKTFEDPRVQRPGERERVFGQSDHVRIYGTDYPDRLRKAGFIVEMIFPNAFLSEKEIKKYALDPQEPIFFCLSA
ncbi:MAG: methyltransferase domain-containing protein [Patescibacteria group bacterium]